MDCKTALGQISSYIDGMLDDDDRVTLEQHIELCAGCRRELEVMRSLLAAAASVTPADPPSELRTRILQCVQGEAQSCIDARALFSAFIDDEVTSSERNLVAGHAAACEACAKEIDELRTLANESAHIASVEPPVHLRQRIAAATTAKRSILATVRDAVRVLVPSRAVGWAAGAAAASVAFAVFLASPAKHNTPNDVRASRVTKQQPVAHVTVTEPSSRSVQRQQRVTGSPGLDSRLHRPHFDADTATAEHVDRTPMPAATPSDVEGMLPESSEVEVAQVPVEQPAQKTESPTPVQPAPVITKRPPAKPMDDPFVEMAIASPAVSRDNSEWIREVRTHTAADQSMHQKTDPAYTNAN